MSGELRRAFSIAMEGPASSGEGARKLGNGRQSPTSPLKIFGQAKKKINDIFVEILSYIEESNNFFIGLDPRDAIVRPEYPMRILSYQNKVSGIREMLNRDRMKVVFFGRTSNGKSTVINAMLKSKVLPTGIGHTTHCFLQVEGSDSAEPYLLTEDCDTPKNIQSVSHLASALSDGKLRENSLIRICQPKNSCVLLRDDVVLVDSPGIDVTPDLDSWIDKFCLDADVFVLVSNAESTLMQTEKNFFHKVSSRLSKPNIFILNNRWDASASEPETVDEVKKQHTERGIAFLADELKVIDTAEASDRIFFVSAREALASRINQERGTPTPSGLLQEGFQGRLFDFCNFERKFQECISQSAVQTKFAQHTTNGKIIVGDLRTIMDDIATTAQTKRDADQQRCQSLQARQVYISEQLRLTVSEMKEKIYSLVDEVERKVSTALVDEIRRLAYLVDEFERPFHPDNAVLSVYKKELHAHVEKGLEQNLQVRCSNACRTIVEGAQHSMAERVRPLVKAEYAHQVAEVLPSRDFDVAYRLDCRNLCADFQEDIDFHFSLGITALMNRFLGQQARKSVLRGYGEVPRPLNTPQTPSNNVAMTTSSGDSDALLALVANMSSLYSRTTIGTLAIAGLVAKAIGWRVLAVCAACYGGVYVYERLTWTKRAMEKSFKQQYVDYAATKLKLIVDLTSRHCSHQVQQELQSTFARLCRLVDTSKAELDADIELLEQELARLTDATTRATFLRNKAGFLDTELSNFLQLYLRVDNSRL